jgi:Fe-S oxidoreductase
VIAEIVNGMNASGAGRSLLEATLGVSREAPVPKYHSKPARRRLEGRIAAAPEVEGSGVAVFATCYGNRNQPGLVEDLVAVLDHNSVETKLVEQEKCCGMPKFELGDLESIAKLKDVNIPVLYRWAKAGWRITAVIPSCVLMFKKELPLLFPGDEQVEAVAAAFVDPFEYLMGLHKNGTLKTEFAASLGQISYQVPCHLRVQNIGLKTRDVLNLVPDTEIKAIERCSGHDGTYAVKKEYHAVAVKIARPVARQVDAAKADHFTSDCPMAAAHIADVAEAAEATHPLQLLRRAYGI